MHPGEVLLEEFLAPLNLSAGKLAKACGIPRTRIERIAKAFETTAELWLNLQTSYDIRVAKEQIGKDLDKIEPIAQNAA